MTPKKVLYVLKYKICGEAAYDGKTKNKFRYRFNNYKSKPRAFRKGNQKNPQKRFQTHYCLDGHSQIDDWNYVFFEQCETHEQLKERETNTYIKPFIQQVLTKGRSTYTNTRTILSFIFRFHLI